MNQLYHSLTQRFPTLKLQADTPLAPFTTVKIGGPAEVFCKTKNRQEFIEVVRHARQNQIPLTLLGWGANTLISDSGIRGLVIRNEAKEIQILDESSNLDFNHDRKNKTAPRWNSDQTQGSFTYEFSDLDYDESDQPKVKVVMDSGVALTVAINYLLNQGVTGLQWFSRIPATIGGAVYNNIHGGTHFFEECVEAVEVITKEGELKILSKPELDFGYDFSRFHYTEETIVAAHFRLLKGDVERAKQVTQEWAVRKKIQPQNSLGCVFQNISDEDRDALAFPTTSVGYIVEHILGKKNFQIGGAKVSEHHAAFIENTGNATAADYLAVIRTIISETHIKTGLKLKPEIFFLGFTPEELAGII